MWCHGRCSFESCDDTSVSFITRSVPFNNCDDTLVFMLSWVEFPYNDLITFWCLYVIVGGVHLNNYDDTSTYDIMDVVPMTVVMTL